MRYLEVRRHSFTKKGERPSRGSHLSQCGVAAARKLGGEIGTFAYVMASEAPRTVETAIAMGFAVDEIVALGSGYVGTVAHHDQWSWDAPFVRYRELLDDDHTLASAADREVGLWRSALNRVPDDGVALVVSHGGIIEPTLIAARPTGNHAGWGLPFSHLDGARLAFDAGQCVGVQIRRFPPKDPPQTSV